MYRPQFTHNVLYLTFKHSFVPSLDCNTHAYTHAWSPYQHRLAHDRCGQRLPHRQVQSTSTNQTHLLRERSETVHAAWRHTADTRRSPGPLASMRRWLHQLRERPVSQATRSDSEQIRFHQTQLETQAGAGNGGTLWSERHPPGLKLAKCPA